jgi:hypothetical protein
VPTIQEIAGGNVNVQGFGTGNTKISFEGTTPLIFGVQGIMVSFDEHGKFTAFDVMKAGEGAVRGLPSAATSQPKMLTAQAIFVDLH